ncbi:MAG TPA: hypothetical protein HA237_05940 [Candidatus Diapherotrites archaeon]|uniref:Uncharacterized protein n=1 Tax=Candidatus Iainarchaeum sp. TaxID=3101447 RepID=A0A7J4IVP3_9ARCH|nr:hypothetical protein [Candidatus Diapherotrites archaeon]
MAVFSQISAKAAAITGAVLGFLCGLFSIGMVGMMGLNYAGFTMMGGAYSYLGWFTAIYGLVIGAIVGGLIAIVYNWALSLK